VSDTLLLKARLSLYFLSPVQLRRRSDRAVWWAPGIHPRLTHHRNKIYLLEK